jgi:hypothetical protein
MPLSEAFFILKGSWGAGSDQGKTFLLIWIFGKVQFFQSDQAYDYKILPHKNY